MSVRIGCGLSTDPDPRRAALEAGIRARTALGDAAVDAACAFASGTYLERTDELLGGLHDALEPAALIGCGAGGVLADGREVERGTALAVWAAALDGGQATAFRIEADDEPEAPSLTGVPDLAGASAAVLLPDPHGFPVDAALDALAAAGTAPVLGGLASARLPNNDGSLLLDRDVCDGAVGLTFRGVEVLPCVSQGATPIGPELTVTAAEGGLLHELAGRPALERLRDAIEALPADEQRLIAGGLLLGIVLDGNKPEYEQGDFLVRGLLGADPETGSIAVGTPIEPGSVVRLHARDAASADRDLRAALELRRTALGGAGPAGALMFTCNGRGSGMFGSPDHDALALREELDAAPSAGFFAAGEIGPVGGEPFLHGFTATVAVFAR